MRKADAAPVVRHRITEPRASVATWLPASLHDALIEVAKIEDKSVSATLRTIIRRDKQVSRVLTIHPR